MAERREEYELKLKVNAAILVCWKRLLTGCFLYIITYTGKKEEEFDRN